MDSHPPAFNFGGPASATVEDSKEADPLEVLVTTLSSILATLEGMSKVLVTLEGLDERVRATQQILDTMQGVLARASVDNVRTLWNPADGINAPGIVNAHLETLNYDGPRSAGGMTY